MKKHEKKSISLACNRPDNRCSTGFRVYNQYGACARNYPGNICIHNHFSNICRCKDGCY